MKVAILGAGHIARLHAPAIRRHPDARIVAVGDHDLARARVLARDLGVTDVFTEPADVLEHAKPDVVHVLAPPHEHARLSLMAMRHGCHVYVEKPMALTLAETDDMIAVARQQQVCLCVGHNLLFDQTVRRALRLAAQGTIGQTVSVEACYQFDPTRYPSILADGAEHTHWSYRLNGGPLQDLMPHPGSLLGRFLSEIEDVHSVAQNRGRLPNGWPDEIRVLVTSRTVLGVLAISLSERPDTISLVLKGTRGTLHVDLFKNIVTLEKQSKLPRALGRGISGFAVGAQHVTGALGNVVQVCRGRMDRTSGLSTLVSEFYAAVRGRTGPPVPLEESRRVVELMCRIWPQPAVRPRAARSSPEPGPRGRGGVALVTGATGFIGSHLVKRLLSEGVRVRALVRRNSVHAGRLVDLDVEVVRGDLTEPEVLTTATRGADVVYHVGAPMSGIWVEHRDATIGGTGGLLRAALSSDVQRFIHVSTLAVYDLAHARAGSIITEDWPHQTRTEQMGSYARAKIEAEQLVFGMRDRHGMPVTVVRPGIVIGPHGRLFFPHLGYRLGSRLFLVPGDAGIPLPLTAVQNTVDGIYRASRAPRAIGQAYNLVDDGDVTIRNYLHTFMRVTAVEARVVVLPYAVPYLATAGYEVAARLGVLPAGLTSRAQLRWKQARVRFDTTRAKTELGWTSAVPIQEALDDTFAWYAARHLARP